MLNISKIEKKENLEELKALLSNPEVLKIKEDTLYIDNKYSYDFERHAIETIAKRYADCQEELNTEILMMVKDEAMEVVKWRL